MILFRQTMREPVTSIDEKYYHIARLEKEISSNIGKWSGEFNHTLI